MMMYLGFALFGGMGVVLRVLLLQLAWPLWGINALGSFAAGLLMVRIPEPLRSFLLVGILGGFTTFSSLTLEFALSLQGGAYVLSFWQLFKHVMIGAACAVAGVQLSQWIRF